MSKAVVFRLFWVVVFFSVPGCGMGTSVTTPPQPLPTLALTATAGLTFDGARAYEDVKFQVDLGPRIPGTEGHAAVIEWMVMELETAGWEATVQEGEYLGFPIRNVVAQRAGTDPRAEWIILGAHFDTREFADQDPDPARRNDPVPGANDGASGVAVLLELARVLPSDLDKNVWLVFFDAEDGGRIADREWIMGASFFVEQLAAKGMLPDAAVVVDMIGDANLEIYLELNSDQSLANEIWGIAEKLGYDDNVIPAPRHRMIDDHLPFRNAGVPVVLMIDFDYPYWHTVEDTPDKVSGQSLKMVGETLLQWLIQR
jgi:glutaminyl-peptide cyclotransferase